MISKKHIIYGLLIVLVGFSAILGNIYYSKIYKAYLVKDGIIYIPSSANFEDVAHLVRPLIKRTEPFKWLAKKKKYMHHIKSGKYVLKKGMSNNDLVNLLRSGNQSPVKVSFNNQDSLEKLSGRIAVQIEPDSTTLLSFFKDEAFLGKNGFTRATALAMYIPNTYEFYWNVSAQKFRKKMLKAYRSFWNTSRLAQAKKIGLTPLQVSILASIVQKESSYVPERKTIAGLYLNRLKNKWPLQADPTIIFANKQKYGQNYEIKRVLTKHLAIDSPYNTYKNKGLPPGLIGMPDISSIDAVLNAEKHEYFYMCASVSNLGKHIFSKSLTQHNINAKKYQNWIAKQAY